MRAAHSVAGAGRAGGAAARSLPARAPPRSPGDRSRLRRISSIASSDFPHRPARCRRYGARPPPPAARCAPPIGVPTPAPLRAGAVRRRSRRRGSSGGSRPRSARRGPGPRAPPGPWTSPPRPRPGGPAWPPRPGFRTRDRGRTRTRPPGGAAPRAGPPRAGPRRSPGIVAARQVGPAALSPAGRPDQRVGTRQIQVIGDQHRLAGDPAAVERSRRRWSRTGSAPRDGPRPGPAGPPGPRNDLRTGAPGRGAPARGALPARRRPPGRRAPRRRAAASPGSRSRVSARRALPGRRARRAPSRAPARGGARSRPSRSARWAVAAPAGSGPDPGGVAVTRPARARSHPSGEGSGSVHAASARPWDVPIRVAPAATMRSASAQVRIPPEAFTPIPGPPASLRSATAAGVAPPAGWNPVEVLRKSAPAPAATRPARRIAGGSSAAVSRITLTRAAPSTTRATAATSRSSTSQRPPWRASSRATMSTSVAPMARTSPASRALCSCVCAPSGNETTVATATGVPATPAAARRTCTGFTHTAAKPCSTASRHSRSTSAGVVSGRRAV